MGASIARFATDMKTTNKKHAVDERVLGIRISENPEYQSHSRYHRGKIERFFLFFYCFCPSYR